MDNWENGHVSEAAFQKFRSMVSQDFVSALQKDGLDQTGPMLRWGRFIVAFHQQFPNQMKGNAADARTAILAAARIDAIKDDVENALAPKELRQDQRPSTDALAAMRRKMQDYTTSRADEAACGFFEKRGIVTGVNVPSYGTLLDELNNRFDRTSTEHAIALRILQAGLQVDRMTIDQLSQPSPP